MKTSNHLLIALAVLTIRLLALQSSLHAESKNTTEKAQIAVDARYALEIEDPYHRHISILQPAYSLWQHEWSTLYPEFWPFLAHEQTRLQNDFPMVYDPSFYMLWLDNSQRSSHKISLQQTMDDKNIYVHASNGHLADGKWMFIALHDSFYAAMERKHQVHHTSLSGGQSVDMAGTITIKDGLLTTISFISGHYRPTIQQAITFLHSLDQQNLDLSAIKIGYCIIAGQMTIKKKVSLEEFLSIDLDSADQEEMGTKDKAFLMSFDAFQRALPTLAINKAELFLTEEGQLYVANRKIESSHPLCSILGSYPLKASMKINGTQITKIIFQTHIDQIGEIEHVKRFVEHLIQSPIDVDTIQFRVIEHHEKLIVTAQDILNA